MDSFMSSKLDLIDSVTIQPGTARTGEIRKGQKLRIVDPEGGQIGDFIALNLSDPTEHLDCSYTNWANIGWRWKQGATIFTNHMNRMWVLSDDPTGIHFTGGGFCSNDARRLFIDAQDETKGCRDCLEEVLEERYIERHCLRATSCFNVFMNVDYLPDGTWDSKAPVTQAGDYVELRAEMDILWALSVCVIPFEINKTTPSPLRVDIYE